MRCKAWVVTAASGTVLLAVTGALPPAPAAAAPPIPVPSPSPGTAACTVDKELGGITGLVATANGYAVTVKGSANINVKVYLLDAECRRTGKSLAYTAENGARDPQDLQTTADGTFWVADTGDDPGHPTRPNVGIWKLAPTGRATLYRFSYPDRPQSAQALLINGDGNPVIITDNPKGPAGIYVPAAAPDPAGRSVPLKHAGDFAPQDTGTENKLGKIGTSRVTGAANSHDGKHVALRTFADAYEWTVPNGDVVAALTTGTPKITPLPNEPQGSAIAYSRDGANFLTVSDLPLGQGTAAQILKYKPSPPAVAANKPPPGAPGIAGKGDTRGWFGRLNLDDLLRILAGIGLLGLLMVVGGIIGIRQSRHRGPPSGSGPRRRPTPPPGDDPDVLNGPTAALAEVGNRGPDRRRGRYDADPYDADPYDADRRYPGEPPPEPPRGERGYGSGPPPYARADDADRYGGSPPPRASAAPPSAAPRGDRGIARSHRPGGRRGSRGNGDPARRGGYSEQHEGFGDILDG